MSIARASSSIYSLARDSLVTIFETYAATFRTALGINTVGASAKTVTILPTANRLLSEDDLGSVIELQAAGGAYVYIPEGLSEGFHCQLFFTGAADGSVGADAGATIDLNGVTGGAGAVAYGYAPCNLIHLGSDVWIASGNIGTVS